jgi:cytochrome c-type protein NapB
MITKTAKLGALLLSAIVVAIGACSKSDEGTKKVSVPGHAGALKSTPAVRAERRAFDGAPPVIPHQPLGAPCIQCHNDVGMAVPDLGYAPPSPHKDTAREGTMQNCRQCHVFRNATHVFRDSEFAGRPQAVKKGDRLYQGAPPVMPHPALLRENCRACHDGPAAREELRCTHPERTRCIQCHAEKNSDGSFTR